MTALRDLDIGRAPNCLSAARGRSPTLLFLPGYDSDMEGTKALALDAFAEQRGLSMLRLDYSGTGSSGGRFEDGTLALWLEEALAALDQLTEGPLILVGSSMGGWIALHLALLRPERVGRWSVSPPLRTSPIGASRGAGAAAGQREADRRAASGNRDSSCCCSTTEIAIDCPVRLLHGEIDPDVPLDIAFRLMRALRSADVQLNVLKGGGHRLSEPHEIDAILRTVAALLEP